MSPILDRLHAISAEAWVRFVQWLNWTMGAALTVVLAINAAYPQFVMQVGDSLPTPLRFAGVIGFAALVQYALARARKAS